MNKVILVVIVLVVALVGAFLAGSSKSSSSRTFSNITDDIGKGAKLYDVRTPEEYADGHFHGALNLPLQTIQAGTYPDVKKDTKLYVYCRSGNRSGQATDLLKKAGFTNITDLGGLSDVQAMGGTLMKM